MNKIIKFVLIARKYKDKDYYKEFNAFKIFDWESDLSFMTEEAKCEQIRALIVLPDKILKKDLKIKCRLILKANTYTKKHYTKAKEIILKYKGKL